MLKKAGVPAYANTMDERDAKASAVLGLWNSLKSECQGPAWGAAAGRSCTPTDIVKVKTDMGVNLAEDHQDSMTTFTHLR